MSGFDSQSVSLPHSKLVSVGRDSSSVMIGNRGGGVVALLKRDNPNIIEIHCFGHKLALCSSQAGEDVASMNDVRDTDRSIFLLLKIC